MSGGHWDYMQFRIGDMTDKVLAITTALGEIEGVLDWGVSGDTCQDCAELQSLKLLYDMFDRMYGIGQDTWGDRSVRCPNCLAYYQKRSGR